MAEADSWLAEGKDEPWYDHTDLERALDEAGLDAVVARSARNVVYLSGMRLPGTLHRLQELTSSPRPLLVVWPRRGDPTLVANGSGYHLAVESGWIDDIRVHQPYTESPWEHCAERLEELGLADGRIGIARRELNVEEWATFREALPDATFVDSFDLMNRVRNVKTDDELEVLRRSVEIQDAAHREVFGEASASDTEKELHARMIEALIRRGAEWAHGMMQSSNTSVMYGGEGPVAVTEGDLIKTDYVSYYRGYAANLSRMAVVGEPTEEQRRKYGDLVEIHRETARERLEPGVEAREVWEFVQRRIDEADHSVYGTSMNPASVAGHSTGVWWHQEEPIFRPGVETELRPGMVVCLEPMFDEGEMGDFWHLQDQFLVTEDGAELLSDGFETDDLYRIGN